MRREIPGVQGLIGITVGVLGVCVLMSLLNDAWAQWPLCLAGLFVGWRFVMAIHK